MIATALAPLFADDVGHRTARAWARAPRGDGPHRMLWPGDDAIGGPALGRGGRLQAEWAGGGAGPVGDDHLRAPAWPLPPDAGGGSYVGECDSHSLIGQGN